MRETGGGRTDEARGARRHLEGGREHRRLLGLWREGVRQVGEGGIIVPGCRLVEPGLMGLRGLNVCMGLRGLNIYMGLRQARASSCLKYSSSAGVEPFLPFS